VVDVFDGDVVGLVEIKSDVVVVVVVEVELVELSLNVEVTEFSSKTKIKT
jgi:hypothetical protein